MKLALRRVQEDIKGTFGGHKGVNFVLNARAVLAPDEEQLIDRYKMGDGVLSTWMGGTKGQPIEFKVTVDEIRKGKVIRLDNIGQMIEVEEEVTRGCRILKELLVRAAKFGGEEIIDL